MITIKAITAIVILFGLNVAASASEGTGSGRPPAPQAAPEQGSER